MINRTQEEIMQNWPKEWNIPLASIRCATFNHEKYISDALDGFLKQETNFPFEIIVHDDASTDRTASIIKEYEQKFPNIIKPIYETENQYSKHNGSIRDIITAACKGKYFALCEGDDYWTDPNKLQMQVDWLENHPDYTMCCSDATIETPNEILDWHRYEKDCDIPVNDMILGGGGFVQTATLVYRRILLDNYPDECKKCIVGDYPLQVWSILNGKVRYLAQKTATYRFFANGSWTIQLEKKPFSYRIKHKQSIINMLNALNSLTSYRYSSTIHEQQVRSVIDLLFLDNIDINLFAKTFKSTIRYFHTKQKILLLKKIHPKNPIIAAIDVISRYLEQLFVYTKHPLTLFNNWATWGRLNWIPDKLYLSLMFRSKMGYWMNWKHPKTFNEKLQWLKIYDRNPLYTKLVDKYEVRKYIAKRIGEKYLVPLLGVWDSPEKIDFEKLPNQFVLKCTHDSASVVICKDKKTFDFNAAKNNLSKKLRQNYYYAAREWPYKRVKPQIIAESYIHSQTSQDLKDYKFQIFNGSFQNCFVCSNRYSKKGLRVTFFDKNWNRLHFSKHYPTEEEYLEKPAHFQEMIGISEQLAEGIPFVRVDFYECDGKLFVGELTFYPGAGFEHFSPNKWDFKFGSLLNLPIPKHSS